MVDATQWDSLGTSVDDLCYTPLGWRRGERVPLRATSVLWHAPPCTIPNVVSRVGPFCVICSACLKLPAQFLTFDSAMAGEYSVDHGARCGSIARRTLCSFLTKVRNVHHVVLAAGNVHPFCFAGSQFSIHVRRLDLQVSILSHHFCSCFSPLEALSSKQSDNRSSTRSVVKQLCPSVQAGKALCPCPACVHIWTRLLQDLQKSIIITLFTPSVNMQSSEDVLVPRKREPLQRVVQCGSFHALFSSFLESSESIFFRCTTFSDGCYCHAIDFHRGVSIPTSLSIPP